MEQKVQTSALQEYFPDFPLEAIEPSPTNPRRHLTEASIAEMAASIRQHGVTQPILLRTHPTRSGRYEIVYGERRYRGSLLAGKRTIPAFVRKLDDKTVAELQLIENLQREDVHELDEARGYEVLMETHNLTVETVSLRIGKSKKYVWDRLKLLELIVPLQEAFYAGRFSAGHAILLARLENVRQWQAYENNLAERMSVRELAKSVQDPAPVQRAHIDRKETPSGSYRDQAAAMIRAAQAGNADAREALSAIAAEMGRRGSRRQKETTTRKQLQQWAREGNATRWKNRKKSTR
jgi:ParB family chromosome partitioning protein